MPAISPMHSSDLPLSPPRFTAQVYDPELHDAIFVSHTWWTRPASATGYDAGAPDYVEEGHPKQNLKFRVICRGIRALLQRDVLGGPGKQVLIWFE